MIGICDYGSGNVQAISNIYTRLNIPHRFISTAEQFTSELTKLVLPGVGAFDETMGLLDQSKLIPPLTECVFDRQVPILGICVGMQIMAASSEEGTLPGLNWIPGRVKLFDKSLLTTKPSIPHLGWNSVKFKRQSPLFTHVDPVEGFYFIHSYYYECDDDNDVLTTTNYGIEFASAINRGNIFGTQFHPEKSHANGIQTLKNFAELLSC
jgi:glutamine amidotransferase